LGGLHVCGWMDQKKAVLWREKISAGRGGVFFAIGGGKNHWEWEIHLADASIGVTDYDWMEGSGCLDP